MRCADKKTHDLLADYLFDGLDESKQEAFELHLFDCDYCREQVRTLGKYVDVLKSKENTDDLLERVRSEERETRKIPFVGQSLWRIAAISAGLLLFLSISFIFYQSPSKNEQEGRGQIRLKEPRGHLTRDILFQWEEVKGASYYIVELYEGEAMIWQGRSSLSETVMTQDTVKLKPDVQYHWNVRAFSSDGKVIKESKKVELRMTSGELKSTNYLSFL